MRVDVLRRRTKHSNLCSDEGRGRVHWFQNTVEDCGLKPILFHYKAIPIRVSLFLISAELKSQPTQSIAENPVAKKHNPIYNVEKTQGGI